MTSLKLSYNFYKRKIRKFINVNSKKVYLKKYYQTLYTSINKKQQQIYDYIKIFHEIHNFCVT